MCTCVCDTMSVCVIKSSDISLVWSQCDRRHPRSHGGSGDVQYPYIKSQNASKYLKRLGYYVL